MSIPSHATMKCPKCGATVEFIRWDTINSEEENAAKRIISGELFDIECKNCGQGIRLDYPILFNDMIHHAWIWFCRPEKIEEVTRSMHNFHVENENKCRIVTSQTVFREKTSIIDAGYDDRLIEIMKLCFLDEIKDQLENRTVDEIFYVHHIGEPHFELYIHGELATCSLQESAYEHVKTIYGDALSEYSRNDDSFIVDRQWASTFLSYYYYHNSQ